MKSLIKSLAAFLEKRTNLVLAAVMLLTILLGIAYSLLLGDKLRYQDEDEYFNLSKNLVELHQYSYDGTKSDGYRPPGYAFVLTPFVFLGAGIRALRMLNFFLLALSMFLAHRILKRHASGLAASLGVFFIFGYPILFYTAGTLFAQTVGSTIFLLVLFLLSGEQVSYKRYIAAGLIFGFLILVIPFFVLMLMAISGWFFLFMGPRARRGIVLFFITACLLVSCWCVRNYLVFNTFVFVSTNSGINLLLGNCENTTPNGGPSVNISKYIDEALSRNLGDVEQSNYFRDIAVEYIKTHKMQTCKMYFLKFLNFFNYRNKMLTEGQTSSATDLIVLFTYGPLLLLFIARILLVPVIRPTRWEVFLGALYLASAAFSAIFFTRIRLRIPFDYLLIMVVAMFLHQISQRWLGVPEKNPEESSALPSP